MNAQGNPPPGWHPDPYQQAQLRYWDGNAWTGHTSGAAPARVEQPGAPATATTPASAQPAATAPTAAQPPAGAPSGTTPSDPRFSRGFVESRLRNPRTLAIFLGAFAVIVLGGAGMIALLGRGDPARDCPPDRECGNPPQGRPLVNQTVWRSEELGFQFEYDDEEWSVREEDGRGVTLEHTQADILVVVAGAPASEASPQDLFDDQLEDAEGRFVGLAEDTDSADQLYGPSLGYVDGVGGAYAGPVDTPQGVVEVSVAVMAAGDGGVSAVAAILTGEQRSDDPAQPSPKDILYGRVDSMLNTFQFPSGGAP